MWKLNLEPWEKWLRLKILSDGEDGGGGAPAGGESGGDSGGGVPASSGGVPASTGGAGGEGAPGVPVVGVPTTTAGAPSEASMWQEQAEYMRQELQRTTQALQNLLRTPQGARFSTGSQPSGAPGQDDLFNIDPKDLEGLHPAVQAMFKAMKAMNEKVGGIHNQFEQTTQERQAANEAAQQKATEEALNTHIDSILEAAQLPKGGTLTNMVNRVALQSLKNLHSQGYAITRNVIDSVVNDLVTNIKKDMAPQTPKQPLPPRTPQGGGGNPTPPPAPTAMDRQRVIAEAIASLNQQED